MSGSGSVVEHLLAKEGVASSNLVFRSIFSPFSSHSSDLLSDSRSLTSGPTALHSPAACLSQLLRHPVRLSSMSPQLVQNVASGLTGVMQWLHTRLVGLDDGQANPQYRQNRLVTLFNSPQEGQAALG